MKKFSLNFSRLRGNNRFRNVTMAALMSAAFAACAPTFHCTEGMTGPGCQSVSQVYKDTHQEKTTSQVYAASHKQGKAPLKAAAAPHGLPQTVHPGNPLRSGERVMRVWMAPWVDKDDDYHDQSYVYLVMNHGRWYVDRAHKRIIRRYAPHVTPPTTTKVAPSTDRGPTYDKNIVNAQNMNGAGKPAPDIPTLDAQILK